MECSINEWCWYNWLSIWKKIKLVSYLRHFIKINTRWIKYSNVKNKLIKVLARKSKILHVQSTDEEPILQALEHWKLCEKLKIFGYVKIKSVLRHKSLLKIMKHKKCIWKFAIQTTKSICHIEELLQIVKKKTNDLIFKKMSKGYK